MALVSRIVLTSLLVYSSFGTALDVSFELEDSDINEIIFVNETDIVLLCCVADEAKNYTLSIEHENRDDPVLLSQNDNFLKLVIKKVTVNDGVYFPFGTPLDVSFELEDSDINEVIFVNETDIVLRCCIAGEANDYTLSIEHENRDDPVLQSRNDNCLNHVIKKVTMNDGGGYTCNISFICVDGSTQTTAKTLYLNVQDGISPQCFRNGTAGQPYNDGDLLLMICYCRRIDRPCSWISSVPGSGWASTVVPYETKNRFDKMILRLLVKVGSSRSTILTTRYHCSNGPAFTQRCQIGPQMASSTDVIINSYTEDTSDNLDCVKLNASTITPQKEVTKITLNTTRAGAANTKFDVIVIAAPVGTIIVFVLIIILLIVFILMKRKKDRTDKTDSGRNHLYSNNVYRSDEHGKDNRNGPTDSYYYDVNPFEGNSQMDHNCKPSESKETNMYMRTIMHMQMK
ncbi:hypothetical protein HOLleu_24830 [Holothuria leucospilota]|uniref:Ig-like domain-containing protein n=1 Tax=Holothuria leucospilota TaxID=206669 RepID=A0A9Q1H440_HOLLE|nr:hypothetical protein HOLleu_24830 [Holothuria leucospilota]